MSEPKRKSMNARTWARRFAMQALYQWQLAHTSLSDLLAEYAENSEFSKADNEYFIEIVRESLKISDELDAIIIPYLDRPIIQIDPVERAILWVGSYELLKRIDIPYKVIINEAVELAKRFGADSGHKYINGILDKVAKQIRTEYQ